MHEHFWRRLALLNADVCVTEIFCHSSCEFFWCLRHYVCNLSTCLCVHATVPKQRHSSTFFLSTCSCLQVRESEISIISHFCALYAVLCCCQLTSCYCQYSSQVALQVVRFDWHIISSWIVNECWCNVQRKPEVGLERQCVSTSASLWCHWTQALQLNSKWSIATFLTLSKVCLSTELWSDHLPTSQCLFLMN